MHITIRDRRWRYRIVHPRLIGGARGQCDSPTAYGKRILVASNLSPADTVEVDIHEFAHAFFWDADEEVIDLFGRQLTTFLRRRGWVNV